MRSAPIPLAPASRTVAEQFQAVCGDFESTSETRPFDGFKQAPIERFNTAAGDAHEMMMVAAFVGQFVASAAITKENRLHEASRTEGVKGAIDGNQSKLRVNPTCFEENLDGVLSTSQLPESLENRLSLHRDATAQHFQPTSHLLCTHRLT